MNVTSIGIIFELVGFLLLASEVWTGHVHSLTLPLARHYSRLVDLKKISLGDIAFAEARKSPSFNEELYEQTLKAFRLRVVLPGWHKKDIIHLAYLIFQNPDRWEKKIETNDVHVKAMSVRVRLNYIMFGGAMFVFGGDLAIGR